MVIGHKISALVCFREYRYFSLVNSQLRTTITSVCCQGIETQDQLQGQGLGPALIQTCYGTEQEVMSLVVYCRCHVTDKQLSASKDLRDSYGLLAVSRMSSSTEQASISLT